jgi:hypothetical protein
MRRTVPVVFWGILRYAAVVFLRGIDLYIGAEHHRQPVGVGFTERPRDPGAHAEWFAAALHLPTVDPDHHLHTHYDGWYGPPIPFTGHFAFGKYVHLASSEGSRTNVLYSGRRWSMLCDNQRFYKFQVSVLLS